MLSVQEHHGSKSMWQRRLASQCLGHPFSDLFHLRQTPLVLSIMNSSGESSINSVRALRMQSLPQSLSPDSQVSNTWAFRGHLSSNHKPCPHQTWMPWSDTAKPFLADNNLPLPQTLILFCIILLKCQGTGLQSKHNFWAESFHSKYSLNKSTLYQVCAHYKHVEWIKKKKLSKWEQIH